MPTLTASQIQANMGSYKQQAASSGRPIVVNERSGYTSHAERWRRPVDERHYEVSFAHYYDVYNVVIYPDGTVERRKVGSNYDEERLIRITPEALQENVKAVEQRKAQEYEKAISDYQKAGSQVERHSAILRAEQAESFVTKKPSTIPEQIRSNITNTSVIPESIRSLGLENQYKDLQYRVARGDISEDQANEILQESVQEKLRSMPEDQAVSWVKTYSISEDEQAGWHPETKVVRSEEGEFNIQYPYAAAQNYQAWKKAVDEGQRGYLSGEDPLGIYSFVSRLQGNAQADIDYKIKALYDERTKNVGNLTYSTIKQNTDFFKDRSDTMKQQLAYILESPVATLALTLATGYGVAKGLAAGAKIIPAMLTEKAALTTSQMVKTISLGGAKWIPRLITGAGVVGITWESTNIGMDILTGKPLEKTAAKMFYFGAALTGGIYGGYKGSKLGEQYIRSNPPMAYTQINKINDQSFLFDTRIGNVSAYGKGTVNPLAKDMPDFFRIRYGGVIEGRSRAVMGEFIGKNVYMAEGGMGKSIDIAIGRSFSGKINYKTGKMFFDMKDFSIAGQVSATEGNIFSSRGLGVDMKGFFLTKGWGEIGGFGIKEVIPKVSPPSAGGSSLSLVSLQKLISAKIAPDFLSISSPPTISVIPVLPKEIKTDVSLNIPAEYAGVYDIPISALQASLWMPKEKNVKLPGPDAIFVSPPKIKSGWGTIGGTGYAGAFVSKEMEDLYNRAFNNVSGGKTLTLQTQRLGELNKQDTNLINKSVFRNVNDNLNAAINNVGLAMFPRQGSLPEQGIKQRVDPIDLSIQKIDLVNEQVNAQLSLSLQNFSFPFAFNLNIPMEEKEIQVGGEGSFYPQFKEKQNMPYKRVNDGPFTREGALRYGGHYVGNSAKASFKLEPTTDKPVMLPNNIEQFKRKEYYYNKKKDIWVEKKKYRINSPGELAEITAKGIEARVKAFNKGRWK